MKTIQEYKAQAGLFDEDITKDIPSKFTFFVYRGGKVVFTGDRVPEEYKKGGYVTEKYDTAKDSREARKAERDRRYDEAMKMWNIDLRDEYAFLTDKQFDVMFEYCKRECIALDEYDMAIHDMVNIVRELGFKL